MVLAKVRMNKCCYFILLLWVWWQLRTGVGVKAKTYPHPFSTYMYVSILNDFWWFGSFLLYLFSIIQVCVKIIRILTEADTNQCTTIHDCWIMCCYYTHGPPYIQPSNVRPRLINNNDAATWLICNNPVIMNICL